MCRPSHLVTGILLILLTLLHTLNSEKVELDQERHKIIVPAKTESCFFISNLEESDTVTVNYLVISFREASK